MEIKVVIEGAEPQQEYVLLSPDPISFTEVMSQLGLNFYRPCGGIGKCMSCAIRFVYGAPEMTSNDERALDFSEMRNGWRLGCKCMVTRDCKIQVSQSLVGEIISPESQVIDDDYDISDREDIAIAVDIGTTTIAMATVEMETGRILKQTNCANSQIKFGADVMSRVKAAMDGQATELKECVASDLDKLWHQQLGEKNIAKKIIFSGNTIMNHLFLGYTVDGLAAYPFIPYTLDSVRFVEKGRNIFFMPGISAFIGGDIVSGLYYIKKRAVNEQNDKFLLVDLGTNAEVVLYDGDNYWCTSASAGPALEGASLSCGVASVKGAINHLSISSGKCRYTTIGGERAIGLCGSGIIDLIHEMHRSGIIDDGGLLIAEYADTGYPIAPNLVITGEDIQQVLLAKAAIYSAIQILRMESGVAFEDIEHLYVSGGLGATVSVWATAGIGLFPKELVNKFEAVGNSSLRGNVEYIRSGDESLLEEIRANSKVVVLNDNPEFQEIFLDSLKIK